MEKLIFTEIYFGGNGDDCGDGSGYGLGHGPGDRRGDGANGLYNREYDWAHACPNGNGCGDGNGNGYGDGCHKNNREYVYHFQ